jgi:hypothetical protein
VPCPSRRVQRIFPLVATGPIASPPACFHPGQIGALTPHQADFLFGHIRTDATPPKCVYLGQIRALTPHPADFIFGHIGTDATPPACVYLGQIRALTPHQADFIFSHIGTEATPPACVYLGQIGALTPHQADFIFGHIGTDATPPACVYLGQIGALTVGDSHEGPLKNLGESCLKLGKNAERKPNLGPNAKYTHNTIHAAVAPAAHQSGPAKRPLERGPPRSRAHAALE